MKPLMIGIVLVGMIFSVFGCSDDDYGGPDPAGRVGWAIGYRGETAAILHTADGGDTW